MLTITQLRRYDSSQWHSDNLETIPEKIGEASILWVNAEDPSDAEMVLLKSRFRLIENFKLEEFGEENNQRFERYENFVSCIVAFKNPQRPFSHQIPKPISFQ